jgi:hypothetical protein
MRRTLDIIARSAHSKRTTTLISFLTVRPGDKGLEKKDSQADKSNLSGLLATLSKFRGRLLYKRKKKTADELVALMKQQLGRDAIISVFTDPVYGWNAEIFAPPSKSLRSASHSR